MKTRVDARSELIGIRVPRALREQIVERAREDERTVSGYLRKLIAAALRRPPQVDEHASQ
jgi:hypothetical protein